MPLLIIISVSTVHVCLFDVNKPVCIRQRTQAYLFSFFSFIITSLLTNKAVMSIASSG